MPAVRARSRRVKSPVDPENGKPHTADTASMRSTSDSGVDVCLDEESSSKAAKRQPLKRKQQQEPPQGSDEAESKKRRFNRNHSAQQSSSGDATSRLTSESSRRRNAKASAVAPEPKEKSSAVEPITKKSTKPISVMETSPETENSKSREDIGESSNATVANDEGPLTGAPGPSNAARKKGSVAVREESSKTDPPIISTSRSKVEEARGEDAQSYDRGRPRRAARASRASTIVKTVIPKGDSDEESDVESETDFSDDDDEDFVFPGEKSDYSDDDIPGEASDADALPEPASDSHEGGASGSQHEPDERAAPRKKSGKLRDKRPERQREKRPERRRGDSTDTRQDKGRSRKPLSTLGRNKNIIKFLKDINQPRSSVGNVVIDLTEDTKKVKTEFSDKARVRQSQPEAERKSWRLPRVQVKNEPVADHDRKPHTSRSGNRPQTQRSILSSDDSDPEPGPSVKSLSVAGVGVEDVTDKKPKRPETKSVSKKGLSLLSSDESDSEPAPSVKSKSVPSGRNEESTDKKPRNSKPKSVTKKKRSHSSSDEADLVPGPRKSGKKVKTSSAGPQRKTFMKPRRAPKPMSQSKSTPGSSRLEMTLLKLAKQMDDTDESEDESQDCSQATVESCKTAPNSVESVKPEPENEVDKKRLIMSMLKEHEEVDEMSDDSSDEEGATGKTSAPKIKNELGSGATTSAVQVEPGDVEGKKLAKNDKPHAKGKKKAEAGKKDDIESQKTAKKTAAKKKNLKKKGQTEIATKGEDDESSGSDDDNWEVVEERDPNYQRPENVTVVLQNEDFLPETKRLSMEQRMIRLINRKRKSSYLLCHRAHFICLIAHQRILNSVTNDDFVRACALSRLPPLIALAEKRQKDSHIVKQILLFYKSAFELKDSEEVFDPKLLKANLIKLLVKKVTSCNIVYLFGLLVLLRASEIRTRLCLSYHLLPQKAPLLRMKDGELVELGTKAKASASDYGIGDFFVEVYMADKKRWRPIDIDDFSVIEDPHELTPHLEQPVACLLGIDESGCMVDLSPKYNADWLDKMKHLRSDAKFFDEALARYAPAESEQADEQQEVKELHEQQGLPKIISQYKNHPKYALSRHLLKFEAFYPREPPVLGYMRNEPVHPRECVHTLRSKDTWHRLARQVKDGELPYSIVKARPKWNKQTESLMRDLPLEVYGEWQTEPYKPPVAENGVIPRNKFGNVELFHPDMLPIGTVHLKLPGLQRIAAELEVDCVPAVVGFDGVGRGCHPVIEGFVVCVENQELLEEAWNERQREDRHKRRERIRKRAVKNWRKLIKKVIWDLRLKRKYKNKLEQD